MSKKILIVDDDAKNLKLAKDILSVNDFIIFEAMDGLKAIDIAMNEKPDLILMDIYMPKMDGITAIKTIKAQEDIKHIPIIALTASAMEGDKDSILDAGADDYLAKPAKIKDLLGIVNKYVG